MIKLNKISRAMLDSQSNSRLSKTLCASTLAYLMAMPAMAQDADTTPAADETTEVIQVKGIRNTIQESIAIKKLSTSIVDGLSSEDIGDLPALSIGEALETLTGASSHVEQGGATEISIRGLGPFLGSNVMNGREAANGSGDRSVNFSQFPSELFNKIAIYKTQEASLIEGGVSGQIHLDTIKPLDYGKQRFQAQVKGNWNPDNSKIENNARDFGSRLTASFVDQYETDSLGEIGISFGVQKDVKTNPEQESRTTSGWRDCRVDPSSTAGVYNSGNCDGTGGGIDNTIDADGVAADADVPVLFVPSEYSYRQNITDDDRESIFGAIQWRPTDSFELNVDAQYSNRDFTEIRNDLVFAENRRVDSPLVPESERLPVDLVITEQGSLISKTNDQYIQTLSTWGERLEEYKGGGINVIYDVSDVFTVSADLSVSKTERRENFIATRLRSEGRIETAVEVAQDGSEIPIWTVQNFDVSDADLFASEARIRADLNQFRNNTITAFRTDFEYLPDSEVFSVIKGGIRVSQLEYDANPRSRDEYDENESEEAFILDTELFESANLACRNDVFPESGFLSSVSGGHALVTNVDSDLSVIAAGTGNTYATFDPLCLATALNGGEAIAIPETEITLQSVDVVEDTQAVYIQADYDTFIGDYAVRGNFGLRYVNTEVVSTGYRGVLTATTTDGVYNNDVSSNAGTLVAVQGGSSYSELLPSFNMVVDVDDDVLVRAALYRGLSRPSPSDMGFGRNFGSANDDDGDVESIDLLVASATANGNPDLQPFTSWNADVAVEWYPNDDTILALGGYYKRFNGGFENTSRFETFTVDVSDTISGTETTQDLETLVTIQETNEDTSTIYGLELTATHAFSYLPDFWSNFGVKLSYNWADSDFEVEDANFGASTIINDDGSETERFGLVESAEIFGFSDTVFSGQFYYQDGGFNAQLIYKYRSEYFQQYVNTPGNLRYVGDKGVYEARVSYKLNSNLKFSIEAINLFDDPKRQYIPSRENFGEINVYGPRIFAGVTYKL